MQDKKNEYDRLEALTIYQIWQTDLDHFLAELTKHEEKEEKDRLAHQNDKKGGHGGKVKKGRAAPAKKDQPKAATQKKASGEGKGGKQTQMQQFAKKAVVEELEIIDDSELTLMERIQRKKGGAAAANPTQQHYPMKSIMTEMDPNEREAIKTGTMKRKAPAESHQDMTGGAKNMQRKKATGGRRVVDSDEEYDDEKSMREAIQKRRQNAQRAGG